MELKLYRYSIQNKSVLGILTIDNKFQCYTLENTNLRIENGIYEINYRKEGKFHIKYSNRFKDIHKGMLEIKNVNNRKYILLHTGNKIEDTKGCILVGNNVNNNLIKKGLIEDSTNAYKRIYQLISESLEKKIKVNIQIIDI